MFEKLFPSGIAEGDAFLERDDEFKRLKNNILKGQHTLLLAPRRYGKTSLAKNVIGSLKFPFIEIDLFVAQNEISIEQKFIKGIQSILSKIDLPENWIKTLVQYFKKSNKTWTVGLKGMQLQISPDNYKDIPENILEALFALEHALKEREVKAIIFIDEFQEIAGIQNSRAIEGAIRNFAQSSKHVVFIFSGSSRHILQQMFDDRSRPLFSLCDEIALNRILSEKYAAYLKRLSKKQWEKEIEDDVLDRIFQLTECHPRYVYYFCSLLWDHCITNASPPSKEDVECVWDKLVEAKLKDLREILNSRSLNQVKLLAFIALGHQELTGQYAQGSLGVSGSAIAQMLKSLESEEILEKSENGSYRIVDPLMKHIILRYGTDYFF